MTSSSSKFTKSFYFIGIVSVVIFLYMYLVEIKFRSKYFSNSVQVAKGTQTPNEVLDLDVNKKDLIVNINNSSLKFILQWTSPNNVPFVYMGKGNKGFIDRNCTFINCYVTSDRKLLGDYTNFDLIAFAGPEVKLMTKEMLPKRRKQFQKFVFASIESSQNYAVCSNNFNGFFNWTWTYKLDSDARWGYIVVRDMNDNIIGPNKNMDWLKLDEMDPVDDEIKEKLKIKKKAAAWFVSNCNTKSHREKYVRSLREALKMYDLDVDVYGRCGKFVCSRDTKDECGKKIETDYYFYLSFENSFAEDYVTEKIIHGLRNYAVPIVYGGANYSRFMPDGAYLNARELSPLELAMKMNKLIQDPDLYSEYFRWRNHYKYHLRGESSETDDYCRFCSMLHDEELVKKVTVYDNFKKWWTPRGYC